MAIRDVITYPDPRLKIEADDVHGLSDKIVQVVTDLKDTMLSTSHSTGIAATQIGEPYRIVTLDASRNKKCSESNGLLVMINPEILEHEGLLTFREGCMSVPDFTGNVTRAEMITVKYFDEQMKEQTLATSGFEAVLIQHETDHLDGILFIDRVISKRSDLFRRKKY